MTDVEKSEISFNMCTSYGILLHFKLFCYIFFAIYAVLLKNWFVVIYWFFCVEKILDKNSVRGAKMTNMRYESAEN